MGEEVIWLFLLGIGAFVVASSLSQDSQQNPMPGPRIVPPKPKVPGGSFGLSPSMYSHTLSDIDVIVGPGTFASFAGYSSLEEFVSDNPGLIFVQPENPYDWPPETPFSYWISGSEDVVTFSPTFALDPNERIPTYTRPDRTGEWVFPFWNTALVHAEGSTIKGPSPVPASSPGVPVVEHHASGIPYALIPWTVGTVVTVRNEPLYL